MSQKLFKNKNYFFRICLLLLFLLGGTLLSTRDLAKADVTQDNTAGTWEGTLGGSGNDIARNTNITVTTAPSGGYQAALSSGSTTGNLISASIVPPSTSLKSWKQVQVVFAYPPNTPTSNSNITFDILCGDQANNCVNGSDNVSFNSPFPGFAGLVPSNGTIDISGLSTSTVTAIRIRANWFTNNTNTASSTLFSWSASWLIKASTSLVISKTPSIANPTPYGSPPGASSNSTVTYTISYSSDQSLTNAVISLPMPAGSYSSHNYSLNYISGGSFANNKITWNIGSIPAGTVGSVTVTVKVPTGPPDQTQFTSEATLTAKNSGGAAITPITTATDSLVISAQSYLYPRIIGPDYVSPSTTVVYMLEAEAGGLPYQGDVFNAKHTFTYPSACFTYSSYSAPAGVTANGATPGQVVFTTGNFYWR